MFPAAARSGAVQKREERGGMASSFPYTRAEGRILTLRRALPEAQAFCGYLT
jgi:hypothetical protein